MLSSHSQRIFTGLAMLVALCAVMALGGWYVFGAALLVALLGLLEYYALFWPGRQGIGKKAIGLVLASCIFLAARSQNMELLAAVLLASFWTANMFFLFCYGTKDRNASFVNAAVLFTGLLYLPLSLQLFLFLSPAESALVLLATIASDTGAYYAGCLIGGPKIWPVVSPKKTWAGSFGGMSASVVVSLIIGLGFGNTPQTPWWIWICLGIILNIAAQFGDFFESALKRRLGVKDSGHLLPGHGGIMDRIDGLVLVLPVYFAARTLYPLFVN